MKAQVLKIEVDRDNPVLTGELLHAALLPLIVKCTDAFPDVKGKTAMLAGFLASCAGSTAGQLGNQAAADLLELMAKSVRQAESTDAAAAGRTH